MKIRTTRIDDLTESQYRRLLSFQAEYKALVDKHQIALVDDDTGTPHMLLDLTSEDIEIVDSACVFVAEDT